MLTDSPRRLRPSEIEQPTPTPLPNAERHEQKQVMETPPSKPQDTGSGDSPLENSRDGSTASGVPMRANTLSWQQRLPRNGPSGPRSRPQSGLINQSAITPPLQKMEASLAKDDEQVSRDDISKKLAQKDAAWFKQTQDRGIGSAAYRRNQETEVNKLPSSVERRRLPGLEHEISPVLENTSSLPERIQHDSRSQASEQVPQERKSATDVSLPSSISHSSTNPSLQDIRLPPPSGAGAGGSGALGRVPALTASQGRVPPERTQRSPSPTKGLGGFVQSAMLKRSDSVSKRWSAQATPGLSRGNSIASVRSSNNASQYSGNYRAPAESRTESISRENSPAVTSRPASSHGSTLQREVLPPGSESKAAADRQPPKDDTEALLDAKTNGHQPSLRDSFLPVTRCLPSQVHQRAQASDGVRPSLAGLRMRSTSRSLPSPNSLSLSSLAGWRI